jgi:hypothetical protein
VIEEYVQPDWHEHERQFLIKTLAPLPLIERPPTRFGDRPTYKHKYTVIPTTCFVRPFAVVPAVKDIAEDELQRYNNKIQAERGKETKATKARISKLSDNQKQALHLSDESKVKLIRKKNPSLILREHPGFVETRWFVLPVA